MMTELPGCSKPTTTLGFGCASLSAGSSRRHSVGLVHAAFDGGIRHFDVAPPYGMGTAEEVLGEALKNRRHDVTVATKVGIAPPKHPRAVMFMRSVAAPIRKLVPGLTRRVGASAYSGLTARGIFAPDFVEASVAGSLRRLRTDHVDLLLLHEVSPDDLTDELLFLLETLRRKGFVRALGTGTSYEKTLAIRALHPAFFDVWQYSWSVLDVKQQQPVGFTITHRAIQRALAPLGNWLRGDATRTRRLSDATGVDLAAGNNLGDVLIGAAMANNPDGITLLSSRQKSRVVANARLMSDRLFICAGQRLIHALSVEPDMVNL